MKSCLNVSPDGRVAALVRSRFPIPLIPLFCVTGRNGPRSPLRHPGRHTPRPDGKNREKDRSRSLRAISGGRGVGLLTDRLPL